MFFFDLIYSFIGKVETSDRRLDVFEFVAYCETLELDVNEVINRIQKLKRSQ